MVVRIGSSGKFDLWFDCTKAAENIIRVGLISRTNAATGEFIHISHGATETFGALFTNMAKLQFQCGYVITSIIKCGVKSHICIPKLQSCNH